MRYLAALLTLAYMLPARAEEYETLDRHADPTVFVVCDKLAQARDIVHAGLHGGTGAAGIRFRHYNRQVDAEGEPACIVSFLDPRLPMTVVEGYRAMPATNNELHDVIIVEMTDQRGRTTYAVIDRFAARGYGI